jgi:hypothetical protein
MLSFEAFDAREPVWYEQRDMENLFGMSLALKGIIAYNCNGRT